jgi:hypothetical protein
VLDFVRTDVGPDGRVRTVTDFNKLNEFTNRVKAETAVRDMGPAVARRRTAVAGGLVTRR